MRESPLPIPNLRPPVIVGIAAAMFAVVLTLRLLIHAPGFGFALLYDVPVALIAIAFGVRAGLAACFVALALFAIGDSTADIHTKVWGYISFTGTLVVLAILVGFVAERLRSAEARLRRSDDNFRAAVEDSAVTVWQQGRDLRYTWVENPPRGVAAGDIVGMTDGDLLDIDQERALTALKRDVLETGERRRAEVRLPEPDPRILDVTINPLRDADGAIVGVTGAAADVTERRRAEEEVRHSEELLARAEELASTGSWAWDVLTDRLVWSEGMHRLHGTSPATFGGNYAAAIERVHPDDRERVEATIGNAFRTGEGFELDRRLMRPDGTVRVVRDLAVVVTDELGDPLRIEGMTQDVTDRRRAEDQFRGLLEAAPDAMVIVDEQGRIVIVNARAEALFGYPRDELVGQPVELLVPERQQEAHRGHRHRFTEAPSLREMGAALDLFAVRKDGTEFAAEISLGPLDTPEGTLVSAAVRDVTARRSMEAANRLLAAIVSHTEDAVVAKSSAGIVTEWNQGAERLYGYSADEMVGHSVEVLVPPERAGEEEEILNRVFRGEAIEQFETVRLRRDGTRVHVSITFSPVRDAQARIVAASTISRDISERKRFEGQLQYLADHDPLTGLFNRRRFEEELGAALARARRHGDTGAVLAIDLDHFKHVNDALGHSVGDQLITEAGKVLQGRLRETDVLARIGGDEFAVILPDADEREARFVADSLLEAVRAECHVETPDGRRRVTASIGVAPYSGTGQVSGEELLVEADIAMYDAKDAGRDRARLYSPTEDRQVRMQARLTWTERVRQALEENRFVLHAQPILPLTGDLAPRHELLLRMLSDDGDLIPPGVFLYIAERTDLMQDVDAWVLREAVGLLAREQAAGNDVRLEVNLSARSIGEGDFASVIADELAAAGADGRGLCIEITETAAIVNVERARRFAARIGELGCEFALDDFGAGFASFYYLKHLGFDVIKIDGEFIKGLAESEADQLVVRSLVEIAHGLGKRTIAEFVGDRAALDLLAGYGVDFAQGFYVARPQPLAETDLARVPVVG